MTANRFRSTCVYCNGTVEAGRGYSEHSKVHGWQNFHKEGECVEHDLSFSHVKPDVFQQAILTEICDGTKHVLIMARAGSGKTTILCNGLTNLYKRRSPKILALAFGNEDGCRMRERLPLEVCGRTTHSWAMEVVKEYYKGAKFKKDKKRVLLATMIGDGEEFEELRDMVNEVLDKVQADAIPATDLAGIEQTIKEYALAIPKSEIDRVVTLTSKALVMGNDFVKWGFDFNDSLYVVALNDIPLPKYDVVAWDETHDLNNAQLLLMEKFVKMGSRMVVVLDNRQAIYLFRGAKSDCYETIQTILSNDGQEVKELPMPVSRRCAKAIIRGAQEIVPDIMALPDAPEGVFEQGFPFEDMVRRWKPGDAILCRNNRPLIVLKYHCLRNKIPAYFRGGMKEGSWLLWLVKMFAEKLGPKTDDVGTLLNRAGKWMEENPKRAGEYQDRVQTIETIGERVASVKALKLEIRNVFAEPKLGEKYITLSTVHLSKGSEWRVVYLICPEIIVKTKARAKTPEAKDQEDNALYISRTRAMLEYYETSGFLAKAA